MRKFALLCLLCALAACGKSNDTTSASSEPSSSAAGASAGSIKTPDVTKAPAGKVNKPRQGEYTYEYSTQVTNNAVPSATPRRSKPGATLTRNVTTVGDTVETTDDAGTGATASVRRRYEADAIVDVSSAIVSGDSKSGCTYTPPVTYMPVPLKTGETKDTIKGTGQGCKGTRTIKVIGKATMVDANGVKWPVWKIHTENLIESVGVNSHSTIDSWFSVDLGQDIKIATTSESIDPDGRVAARGTSDSLLSSFPT